jgi:2-polyprenyl-3-methyl-5-hydroxy-6-metoxy-1,4-benzoquinol methylase
LGKGLRGVGEGECEAGKEGEGLKILDLGCGWGSLGLFLAEVRTGSGSTQVDSRTFLLRPLGLC